MSRRQNRALTADDKEFAKTTRVRVLIEAPASAFDFGPAQRWSVPIGTLPDGRGVAVNAMNTYNLIGAEVLWDEALPLTPGAVVVSGASTYVRGFDGYWYSGGQKFSDADVQEWFDADLNIEAQSSVTTGPEGHAA